MKVLVVGSGGREHALCWKLNQSKVVDEVLVWPGSVAMGSCAKPLGLPLSASHKDIVAAAKAQQVSFVVVGPEQPLAEGFADLCLEHDLKVFGPSKAAAMLEASKNFAKEVMEKASIPTASYQLVENESDCRKVASAMLLEKKGTVIKASGLAGGKGVFVCFSEAEIETALEHLYRSKMKSASAKVVVEEVLVGRECSFFAFVGEGGASPLGFAVDFKRLKEKDEGPNTGGMGCYSPVLWLPEDAQEQVMERVVEPLLKEMAASSKPYTGCLYVGIMWSDEGPKVVEFNVRLGDPEAQVLAVQDQRDWGALLAQKVGLLPKEDLGPLDSSSKSVCVVLASGGYPYGGKEETHPQFEDGLFSQKDSKTAVFGAAVKEADDKSVAAGSGRVMTVVARGEDLKKARLLAYKKVEEVTASWPDVQYRKDIGLRAMEEESF